MGFGGGRLRMFRTVEADRKTPSTLSWLAILTLPQSTLALAISQTRAATSAAVLFGEKAACGLALSILCSCRGKMVP